jgi:chromosomal replication initiator protein
MDNDHTVGRGGDFSKFQAALNRRFGDAIVASWMSDLKLERATEDSVTLSTESQVKCDAISQRFIMMLKETWCEEVAPIRKMSIMMRKALQDGAARIRSLPTASNGATGAGAFSHKSAFKANGKHVNGVNGARRFDSADIRGNAEAERSAYALENLLSPLDERSTFESFAVDDSNSLAYSAARRVLLDDAPAEVVYIYGQSGLGKTHILHAIGNAWRARNGDSGCAYLAYHNMSSGCSVAWKSGSLHALHRDLLAQKIVLIDDVHLLGGAHRTQEEILKLVNAPLASGRRLVIAGELAPAKLAEAGINERLASCLAGGLSVPILPGGDKLRAEVLRKRLATASLKCEITDEAVTFIATHFPQSMREAIGAFNQLVLIYGERNMKIGVEEAGSALRDRLSDRRRTPTLEEAAEETAKAFDISLGELKGRGQPQRLARARHAFVFVGREVLRESFPRISRTLGRDHTTAMSGYHRAQALLERDKKFQAQVKAIEVALGGPN